MSKWQPILTGPKAPRAAGWTAGPLVYLLIPYDQPDWDVGFWDARERCWRFTGEDGPDDIQPTHWAPLPAPPDLSPPIGLTQAEDLKNG
jgi:hypothetical protein